MPHRGRYTERPALQARPVVRAAFFATRLSPAPDHEGNLSAAMNKQGSGSSRTRA
jgi:hypothetical protein